MRQGSDASDLYSSKGQTGKKIDGFGIFVHSRCQADGEAPREAPDLEVEALIRFRGMEKSRGEKGMA